MRSSLGDILRRTVRLASEVGKKAAVAAMILAVLAFAATHVEADHAPPSDTLSVAIAATSSPSAPHGDGVFSAADCSAPCAATMPAATATQRAALSSPRPVRLAREPLFGAELARATPPPRIR